jgi:hypothetical protein
MLSVVAAAAVVVDGVQLSVGDSHGKFIVEEFEVGL